MREGQKEALGALASGPMDGTQSMSHLHLGRPERPQEQAVFVQALHLEPHSSLHFLHLVPSRNWPDAPAPEERRPPQRGQ